MSGVRGGVRQLEITALLPTEFHEHSRVAYPIRYAIVVWILRDHLGRLRTVWGSSRESFRQAPRRIRDAHRHRRGRTGRAERSSWHRRSERRGVPKLAASNAGGEASAACPGSATESISPLWRPWSLVGCAVRGRPSAISSPGSLQRQPRRNGDEPRPVRIRVCRSTRDVGVNHTANSADGCEEPRPARTRVERESPTTFQYARNSLTRDAGIESADAEERNDDGHEDSPGRHR